MSLNFLSQLSLQVQTFSYDNILFLYTKVVWNSHIIFNLGITDLDARFILICKLVRTIAIWNYVRIIYWKKE